MKFTAALELHGKTATGITVPPSVVEALGSGKRPKVVVTFNGYSYRTSVAPMGGLYLIPVRAEIREAAQASAGDVLDVQIVVDEAPRTVDVPDDLAAALTPAARARFDALSFSHQREHVEWISSAKKPETRANRIGKTVEKLSADTSV
ncbi:YdeI/OmpD-associated family protein [Jatrophihabitans telluris]|uniref:YdeI/OmpD-associated family protein n=1 Tax=Jatrophihabitans telluris TaxID=2038343 RepID=A0ABY4QYH3_9ACTN|nr:YdeI/OmpD-associated family protein [Jatrophihabitans telluris]UQX88565.1 YdeI/OmpD-associated family protein [Jatrophihabitans telluris]